MKNKYIVIILCVIITSCTQKNTSSYKDYITDQAIMKKIDSAESCSEKLALFKKIRTLDYKYKFQHYYQRDCDPNFAAFKLKKNEGLLDILDDMMVNDQTARENFDDFIYTHHINERTKYLHVFDSMVGKVDRRNQKTFDSIISHRGEWIGAEYIPQKPGYPKLAVMIGHWPEKYFQKYTLMAYKNAKINKEYWHTVEDLVAFSFKYSVNNEEELKKGIHNFYPFRFSEIHRGVLKNSGITQIEFNYLVEQLDPMLTIKKLQDKGISESIIEDFKKQIDQNKKTILLSSSLSDQKHRKQLINQAEEKLLELGAKNEQIKKDYTQMDNKNFKLYYKIYNDFNYH